MSPERQEKGLIPENVGQNLKFFQALRFQGFHYLQGSSGGAGVQAGFVVCFTEKPTVFFHESDDGLLAILPTGDVIKKRITNDEEHGCGDDRGKDGEEGLRESSGQVLRHRLSDLNRR